MEQPFDITTNPLDNFWIPFTGNKDFKKAPVFWRRARGCITAKKMVRRSLMRLRVFSPVRLATAVWKSSMQFMKR